MLLFQCPPFFNRRMLSWSLSPKEKNKKGKSISPPPTPQIHSIQLFESARTVFSELFSHENHRRDGFALHTQSNDWRVVGSTTAVDFYKTRTKICNAGKIVTSIAAFASSTAVQSNVSLCRAFLEVKDRSR